MIRLVLVDDHTIVRDGLRFLLEKEPDMEVVGEGCTGQDAVKLAAELAPDAVVMDVSMPEMDGIDAAVQVRSHAPSVKVIALSMQTERRFLVQMLQAGASAYVLKDAAFDELARAIRLATANDVYVSNGVLVTMLSDLLREAAPTAEEGPSLTEREREVFRLLAEGYSTKGVASRLGISVQTVSTHRVHLMAKLGLESTADLVRRAIQEGVIKA